MSTSFPPFIHMFSTGWFYRLAAVLFLLGCAGELQAQTAPDTTLYRVFLRDGSTILSYGEYARVADRVIMSLQVGTEQHMLSIPSDTVDWERTDAYAESSPAVKSCRAIW